MCVVCCSFAFLSGSVKLNCYLDEIDSSTMFVLFLKLTKEMYTWSSRRGFLFGY